MLPGPVFFHELRAAARKRKSFVIRTLIGLFLLYLLLVSEGGSYRRSSTANDWEYSAKDLARIGGNLFSMVVWLQAMIILLLTPAFVAGSIVEDRQRKVLSYLLASPLTGAEIVLGKLAARLINLVVLVAVGLPVVSIALFLGGVAPDEVWLCYGLSFTSLYFLAGVSIFASAFSARPRDAIVRVYAIEGIWLIFPFINDLMRSVGGLAARIAREAEPVTQWITASTPSILFDRGLLFGSKIEILGISLWAMGLQVLYGTALIGWATLRLRPVEKGSRLWGLGWLTAQRESRPRRLFPRRPCGDRPMIWKECGGSLFAPSIFRMISLIALGLVALAGLGYWVYALGLPALREVRTYGYGILGPQRNREVMSISVRVFTTVLYILSGLLIAAAAATGVTSEREKDTWVSLTATPLSAREIVSGKFLGSIWRVRALLGALLLIWIIGLVCGSVHPLGLLLAVLMTSIYLPFVAALGTFISLASRSSARAISGTVAILVVLNGGYLFCCVPMMFSGPGSGGEIVFAGMTPFFVTMAPFSYEDLDGLLFQQYRDMSTFILAGIVSLVGYALAAVGLYLGCLSRFEIQVDRPRRELLGSLWPAHREGIVFEDESETGAEGIEFVEEPEAGPDPARAVEAPDPDHDAETKS